jgi:hypothetical protein
MPTIDLVFDGASYKRSQSAVLHKVQTAIGGRYGMPDTTIVTASGMEAITTAIVSHNLAQHKRPVSVIMPSEMYEETEFCIRYVMNTLLAGQHDEASDIQVVVIGNDEDSCEGFLNAIDRARFQDVLVFAECASNPSGIDFPLSRIRRGADTITHKRVTFIVDNTWLTSAAYNPFEDGAHIVVASLTKHYSGGRAIAGAIMFTDKCTYDAAVHYRESMGAHVSDANLEVIAASLAGVNSRVSAAAAVREALLKCSWPKDVRLRGSAHPLCTMCTLEFHFPAHVDGNVVLRRALQGCGIDVRTSYGGPHLRLNDDVYLCTQSVAGSCGIYSYRISIGYEDSFDHVQSCVLALITHVRFVEQELEATCMQRASLS